MRASILFFVSFFYRNVLAVNTHNKVLSPLGNQNSQGNFENGPSYPNHKKRVRIKQSIDGFGTSCKNATFYYLEKSKVCSTMIKHPRASIAMARCAQNGDGNRRSIGKNVCIAKRILRVKMKSKAEDVFA